MKAIIVFALVGAIFCAAMIFHTLGNIAKDMAVLP